MEWNSRDVYRPKKKRRNWAILPVAVILVLVGGLLLLFSSWQKYLVYGQDGLRVELPWMAETDETGQKVPDTYRPTVHAEVVLEGYDFSGIQTDAGQGVTTLKAMYVPSGEISETGIASYQSRLEVNNANALVLQLKPESGRLAYQSGVYMATAYDLNGTFDLTAQVAALKEENIYLVAELSCSLDELLAQRYAAVTLKNADGSVYQDDAGAWLDLYNTDVRQYVVDLCLELADMGFDEVLLSNVSHPNAENLVYTETMTTAPDKLSAVSSFSYYLEQAVGDWIKLSLRGASDALRNGVGSNGQDMSVLYQIYDRVYCASDASVFSEDLSKALGYMTEEHRDRFVPVAYTALSDDSWMVLPWVEPE